MSHRRKVSTKRAEPAVEPTRWMAPVGLALILLLTFVIYTPSLNGARLWDDDGHITRPELQSLQGLSRIWTELNATQQYYPLLHSMFWLEHKLWGDSVVGYHLVNLIWHMCAVLLLYLILVRLKVPGALLAAAIFAVHPIMVESVAWMSEQKNTLSAVFYLSAMLVYLSFDESRLPSRYFLALGLFVLGLLTKTVTATLPAALLVIFWWQRGTLSWKRDILPLLPFFALGAVAGALTAYIERTLIGAEGAGFEMTLVDRGLVAGRAIWFYVGKLVWPTNLIFIYRRWTIDPGEWWQWIFPVAAIGVTVGLLLSRKRWRGPLAGWLLFAGTLAPVLGFLNVFPFIFSFVADHFQYLASLGLIVLTSAGIARGLDRLPQLFRPMGVVLCLALIGALATLTFRQSGIYANSTTLYRTTLDRNPGCWMAHNNLGQLVATTDPDAAMAHYQAAVGLRPDYPEALNNIGAQLMQMDRYPESIEYLEHAVRVKPDDSTSHNNLGRALFKLGNVQMAADQFRLAVQCNARDADAQANYANWLSRVGEMDDAIAHYKTAVQIRPNFMEVHYRLAELLRQRGQYQDAIEHYQAALQYSPEFVDIYADLAAIFGVVNQPTQATATALKGIDIARSTHQEAAAERLDEWLKHYRLELRRVAEPPSAERPK